MWHYSLLFVSFLLSIYGLLRRKLARFPALIGLVMVFASTRFISHTIISYTNFPYAIYLILSAILLKNFVETNKRRDLLLASIILAIAGTIRMEESLWIVLFATVLFVQEYRNVKSLLNIAILLVIVGLFMLPWELIKNMLVGQRYTFSGNGTQSVSILIKNIKDVSIVSILNHYWINTLKYDIFAVLAFIGSLFVSFKDTYRNNLKFQILFYLLLNIFLLLGSIVLRLRFGEQHWQDLGGSMERLTIFIAPLLMYFTAENLFVKK